MATGLGKHEVEVISCLAKDEYRVLLFDYSVCNYCLAEDLLILNDAASEV